MIDFAKGWLPNLIIAGLIKTAIAVTIVFAVVRFLQHSFSKYVKDVDSRYRARRFVAFVGYIAGFLAIASIFSDRLGGFAVSLSVAGAGIAFALQAVIASVAGWVALSIGSFYRPGDRVQLRGIKGDVIDITILRTTLMEIGEWVAEGPLHRPYCADRQ